MAVRGGYDRAAGWTRTAPRTPLTYSPLIAVDNEAAVVANNLTAPVLLDGFAISSPAGLGGGRSTIGVRVRDCAQTVTLSNNTITAGNGNTGLNGLNVLAGAAGADGWDAVNWRGPAYPANAPPSENYAGSSYFGNGGTFLASTNYYGVTISKWEGFPGKDGDSSTPDATGTGGAGGLPNGTNGGPGSSGAAGTAVAHGAVAAGIQLAGSFTSTEGGTGIAGTAGGKGGGGGGGGCITNINNPFYYGGGGGAGGTGGGGGAGGKGGKGGGGSFAVMVVNSSVTVTACTLTTGNGGTGGAGGQGGPSIGIIAS